MKRSLPDEAYTKLADEYCSRIDTKPHNAYYERPAVISLIPEVGNKRILDAGCGPGVYSEWLLEQGALVTGIDANEKMLEHAEDRLTGRAELRRANLEEPLDFFSDESFDGIVSPLTVTYIEDQHSLFREFHRILKETGWFVFSTEHPFFSYRYFGIENYFETRRVECTWNGFSEPVTMPSYYRSMGSIITALTESGFVIDRMLEPLPTEEFRQADGVGYDKLSRFPLFVCIRARKLSPRNIPGQEQE